jgi:hypothetical protein
MATATTRPASSLNIPSTQNTAPILEFTCLYTHDLRQKKKRWQDGVLWFHTFNKRVMVYDVQRNFIGDTHWRQEQFVQEGDDIKLDKGVLIEVGELLATTEQDLTSLLEKRKPVPEARPENTSTVLTRPAVPPLSQLRPKSLNELLGTSRGTYGRAVSSKQSPYEQSHNVQLQEMQDSNPPKRLKLSVPAEPSLQPEVGARMIRPSISISTAVQKLHEPRMIEQAIVVESDDESPASLGLTRRTPLKEAQLTSLNAAPKSNLSPKNTKEKGLSVKPPPSTISNRTTPDCRNTVVISTSPDKQDGRPLNLLRPASNKRRLRLKYRDLLPNRQLPLGVLRGDINVNKCCIIQGNPKALETGNVALSPITLADNYPGVQKENSKSLPPNPREPAHRYDADGSSASEDGFQDWIAPIKKIGSRVERHTDGMRSRDDQDIQERMAGFDDGDILRQSREAIQTEHPDADIVLDNDDLESSLFVSQEPRTDAEAEPMPVSVDERHTRVHSISRGRSPGEMTFETQGPPPAPPPPAPPPQATAAPQSPAALPSAARGPHPRSPFKKSLSDITKPPNEARRVLMRVRSDTTGLQKSPVATHNGQFAGLLPWGPEAFDLFGWRPGEEKGKRKGQEGHAIAVAGPS